MQISKFSVLLLLPVMLSSCSINKMVIRKTGVILNYGMESMQEETDLQFAEDALAANLKMIEALIKGDPTNQDLLVMAAEGFTSYSLGFVEDVDTRRASAFYIRAKEYGLRALKKQRGFGEALEGNLEQLGESLQSFGMDDVPALFWTAIAWGNYINLNRTSPMAIVEMPQALALMERVLELDDTYFNAGPHMFFGVILASRSKMLGGDPEKAREYFEDNIRLTDGRFLMNKVYYAQYYARQAQDKDLFTRLLNEVLEAKEWPAGMSLMNLVAQRKATVLLDDVDIYF
jgi:hypothetical protein